MRKTRLILDFRPLVGDDVDCCTDAAGDDGIGINCESRRRGENTREISSCDYVCIGVESYLCVWEF